MDPSVGALLLLFTLTTQALDELEYCREPRICPKFTRLSANQKYEERLYEASTWACTMEEGTNRIAITKAYIRLITYWNSQSWARGEQISLNTWPSLASVKLGLRGPERSLCWLVPPGLTFSSYGGVTVMTIPKTTMFVRSFVGFPTYESGLVNLQKLRDDLAQQDYDQTTFYGAGYGKVPSSTYYNEIWIPKVDPAQSQHTLANVKV